MKNLTAASFQVKMSIKIFINSILESVHLITVLLSTIKTKQISIITESEMPVKNSPLNVEMVKLMRENPAFLALKMSENAPQFVEMGKLNREKLVKTVLKMLVNVLLSVETEKSNREKLVKTVLKMSVNVLLSVEMEKENLLKTVLIVLLIYLFVPLLVEMEKLIQENPVMMVHKMGKTKNVP